MDKFEKILRDKLQGHEMPYNPAAWAKMEAKLGAPAPNTGAGWKGYFIGGAAATIIGVGAFLLYKNTNPETPNAEKATIAANDKNSTGTVESNDAAKEITMGTAEEKAGEHGRDQPHRY